MLDFHGGYWFSHRPWICVTARDGQLVAATEFNRVALLHERPGGSLREPGKRTCLEHYPRSGIETHYTTRWDSGA